MTRNNKNNNNNNEDDEKSGCFSKDSCFCCCCLPLKPSITITTISIIISLIIGIILSLIFFGLNWLSFFIYLVYIIVIISLIVLLIGIYKENIPFMLQFKPVFLFFLIFQTIIMIYDIIQRFKETPVEKVINGKTYTVKESISTFLKILLIILAIINLIILICYYFATNKLINLIISGDYEDEKKRIENNRRLEENRDNRDNRNNRKNKKNRNNRDY